MRNVTGDAFIPEKLILPQCIVPLCEDPARVVVLATLPTPYIPGLAGGRWEEWRRDWVIATTEANERLALPTGGPASDKASWRAKPSLQPEFDSVLDKIRSLAESGRASCRERVCNDV